MSDEGRTQDRIALQLNSIEELQAYTNAQFQQINALNKKLNKIESENAELKKALADSARAKQVSETTSEFLITCDEEFISINEIKKLRDISIERELNNDECKRLEVYVRILDGLKSKKKKDEQDSSKALSTEELMAALKSI